MHLHDKPPAYKGIFTLSVYRRDKLIEQYVDRNLIVDAGRAIQAQLLGGDVDGSPIASVAFGTNGAPAAPADAGITARYIKAIDGHDYPSPTTVAFHFSLGAEEANGLEIVEFGLITGNDTLYARKVRQGAITKEQDLTLTGTWQILF